MSGYWLETVDRQRGDAEEFGKWFDAVHRQRRSTETFGFWLDTLNRKKGCTATFDHWLDTLDRQRWVLRHFVTDQMQQIVREGIVTGCVTGLTQ